MNIEQEILGSSNIIWDKLTTYGFLKQEQYYLFQKEILNNTFQIQVQIDFDGNVKVKVYDLSFDTEYTNFRLQNQTGKFALSIKEQVIETLEDIKKYCFTQTKFKSKQANRIASIIKQKYQNEPEFLWDKYPTDAIFRNENSQKWYALIMNISKNKLEKNSKEEQVEILNVKLNEEKIIKLLSRKGFYKAYHMNKKSWITMILDETIADEEVLTYIEESHRFTEEVTEWLIPANPKYFDIVTHFNENKEIDWKQSSNIKPKDIVYLYVTSPICAVLYQCEVTKTDIPYSYKDENLTMKKVMHLKLKRKFSPEEYPIEKLKEYGITTIRGPRKVPERLSNDLKK